MHYMPYQSLFNDAEIGSVGDVRVRRDIFYRTASPVKLITAKCQAS